MTRDRTELSHVDAAGRLAMVDVSSKDITARRARARGVVSMHPETAAAITAVSLAKGDAIATARLAGIMAAKRTDQLIPLCHSLPLDHVEVTIAIHEDCAIIESLATTSSRTGVEMEALTAVSVAALTLYDMCKAIDKDMVIGSIELLEKHGGRSGSIVRSPTPR